MNLSFLMLEIIYSIPLFSQVACESFQTIKILAEGNPVLK